MKFKNKNKLISCIFCVMLIVAMAFTMVGCSTQQGTDETPSSAVTQGTADVQPVILGEGQTKFIFTVTDKDGNEKFFEIHTDKETVGAALMDVELISGEDGPYGLYVKSVDGIVADYDVDGTYWAFYVNGEYASSGVDKTAAEADSTYSFKVEK